MSCTATNGTGLGNCPDGVKGQRLGNIFLNKGTTTTDLNKAQIESWILANKLTSFASRTIAGVEDADNENQFATASSLIQRKSQDAMPTETFKFWEGQCFFNNAQTHESFNRYDCIRVFEKGLEVVLTKDEKIKGFNLGMVTINHYKEANGGEVAETMVKIQYVNPNELYSQRLFFKWADLDFELEDVKGILECVVNVVSNEDNLLTIKLFQACNYDPTTTTTGANREVTSLILSVAGSFTLTGATIDDVTLTGGNLVIEYTGTPTAVSLNIVEDVDGNFYKSASKTIS
jgi:hypothetical protein